MRIPDGREPPVPAADHLSGRLPLGGEAGVPRAIAPPARSAPHQLFQLRAHGQHLHVQLPGQLHLFPDPLRALASELIRVLEHHFAAAGPEEGVGDHCHPPGADLPGVPHHLGRGAAPGRHERDAVDPGSVGGRNPGGRVTAGLGGEGGEGRGRQREEGDGRAARQAATKQAEWRVEPRAGGRGDEADGRSHLLRDGQIVGPPGGVAGCRVSRRRRSCKRGIELSPPARSDRARPILPAAPSTL